MATREEWALAVAEHFFKPDKRGQTVLLDVDESVLRRISDDKGWNLTDPVADLAGSLEQNDPSRLFWNNRPFALDGGAGIYEGLPTGLADFALGMVMANRHFASQAEWSRAFNGRVGIADTGSIFNSQQTGTNRNLRILLHSIHEWCEDADMGDIPPFPPPFYPWNHTNIGCRTYVCNCPWGGWGYIGKFYDHLETTREDKRTFLDWINGTMRINDWLDYEDLIEDKSPLEWTQNEYIHDFSERLQQWFSHKILREKFWTLVDNYLGHLIELRDNPRQRAAGVPRQRGDDLEEEEIRSIVERKDSIRPIIWVERSMSGSRMEYHLHYDIEEMSMGTSVELDGEELPLPLSGEHAARAAGSRRIHVDGTQVVQKLTGLHPLCVLVEEDSTFKSRHMLEDSEHAEVPGGSTFHLLCFGSRALRDALGIIKRLTEGQNHPHEILVQGMHSEGDTPPRDFDDPLFGPFHAESVFLFRDLERNWVDPAIQDPSQLRLPKTGSTLNGIRHRLNSMTFHTFGGHPELVVKPGPGQKPVGNPALIDLGAGRFSLSQDMLDDGGAQTQISQEYEWRPIERDEIGPNNPVLRDEFGSVTQAGQMVQPHQDELERYSDEARTASADMPALAEDHGQRIFLKVKKTLSETIDAESRFPSDSRMRSEFEDTAGNALERASIDEINEALGRSDSVYVRDNRGEIVAKANAYILASKNPRSGLKGLHELGQRGANVGPSQYERHIRNMAYKSIFYKPLLNQLEQFGQDLPPEVADAIRNQPLRAPPEFSEIISKLRMMRLVGEYPQEQFDSEIEPLLGSEEISKPWKFEESANREDALELIDNFASPKMKDESKAEINKLRYWTVLYDKLRGCIERCDHKALKVLDEEMLDLDLRSMPPGTFWVRLAKEMDDDTWLTGWTNLDEATALRNQCRRMYDRLNLSHIARETIERCFRSIGSKLNFIQELQENLDSSMEGEEE